MITILKQTLFIIPQWTDNAKYIKNLKNEVIQKFRSQGTRLYHLAIQLCDITTFRLL